MRVDQLSAVAIVLSLAGCMSPMEQGEALYRQGDVRGALLVWNKIPKGTAGYASAQARLGVVEGEFERLLRRYEKKAAFLESEGRLAEAVVNYRLTYKMDPARTAMIDKVQLLVRALDRRQDDERKGLQNALSTGDLKQASAHASALDHLNPLDPSVQIEIRNVRAATGARVQDYIADGEQAWSAGNRADARSAFKSVLAFQPRNETALGYLRYMEKQPTLRTPPRSLSQEQILAEGHFHAANQAANSGDDFWAIIEYEATLAVDPEHRGARRALTDMRKRMQSQVPELYELGKRYFQDEDLHNALRAWRRALSIDPTDERTRENVQRAERILIRLEELQHGARR